MPLAVEISSSAIKLMIPALLFLIVWYTFTDSFIIYFLERGREGERGEKHQCAVASRTLPTGDLALNPSMCPDWESNQQPSDSQTGTQPLSHTSQG